MLIDSHAHLNDERYFGELPDVIRRAQDAGVEIIVNIGGDLASSWVAVELAEQYEGLYAVVGLHPHDAKDCTPKMLDEFRQMTLLEKVVAVGEAGLDFHYDNSPRPVQKSVFIDFIHLAAETNMPLVIHSREAEQATLDIVDEHMQPGQRAIIHCFGSDFNFARNCTNRGFLLGMGGVVTFPNSKSVRAVGARIALEHMVLETDCPYLAPQAVRGRRNEPSYLPYVAQELAALKGTSVEEVARVTTGNTRAFYRI